MTRRRLYPKTMRGTAGLSVDTDSGKFVVVVRFFPESRPTEPTEIRIETNHWELRCAAKQMRDAVSRTVESMQATLNEMGGPR